jgi:hypothetical protein
VPFLGIEWETAADFSCNTRGSSGELKMLAFAATLAGQPIIPDSTRKGLGDLLIALDDTNTLLVLEAIAHAAGWHERGITREITGHAPYPTTPVRSSADEAMYRRLVAEGLIPPDTR